MWSLGKKHLQLEALLPGLHHQASLQFPLFALAAAAAVLILGMVLVVAAAALAIKTTIPLRQDLPTLSSLAQVPLSALPAQATNKETAEIRTLLAPESSKVAVGQVLAALLVDPEARLSATAEATAELVATVPAVRALAAAVPADTQVAVGMAETLQLQMAQMAQVAAVAVRHAAMMVRILVPAVAVVSAYWGLDQTEPQEPEPAAALEQVGAADLQGATDPMVILRVTDLLVERGAAAAGVLPDLMATAAPAAMVVSALSGLALLGNSHLLTQEIYDFLHSTIRRRPFAKPYQ